MQNTTRLKENKKAKLEDATFISDLLLFGQQSSKLCLVTNWSARLAKTFTHCQANPVIKMPTLIPLLLRSQTSQHSNHSGITMLWKKLSVPIVILSQAASVITHVAPSLFTVRAHPQSTITVLRLKRSQTLLDSVLGHH